MFVLFFSLLKTNTGELARKIKDFKLVIYLIFLTLIITPVLLYFVFNIFLEFEYAIAILVLLVMPVGMSVPVYAHIFKSDKELALIIAIITSLLCPLTIPLLIYFLVGIKTNIDFFQMFLNLCIVIFIPFILSILFRKIWKKFIDKTEKYYSSVSIIVIMFIMAGAIAKIDVLQIINNKSIIFPFLSLFILAILLHIIGYYAVYKKDNKIKITSSLATAYMNSTLAIVLAAKFFSPEVLLLVILYQIPTNLILIGFGYIVKRRFPSLSENF